MEPSNAARVFASSQALKVCFRTRSVDLKGKEVSEDFQKNCVWACGRARVFNGIWTSPHFIGWTYALLPPLNFYAAYRFRKARAGRRQYCSARIRAGSLDARIERRGACTLRDVDAASNSRLVTRICSCVVV